METNKAGNRKVMNNERYNKIIDEVYKNYKKTTHKKNEDNGNCGQYSRYGDNHLIDGVQHLTKGSFIQMVKIDKEFSERWGLKIEERELSLEERLNIAKINRVSEKDSIFVILDYMNVLDKRNIPTKLTTLTYKDYKEEIIKSYE